MNNYNILSTLLSINKGSHNTPEALDYDNIEYLCSLGFEDMVINHIMKVGYKREYLFLAAKYALEKVLVYIFLYEDIDWNIVMEGAARGGHIELVQLALENRMGNDIVTESNYSGVVAILEKYPLPSEPTSCSLQEDVGTPIGEISDLDAELKSAAESGNLDDLKRLLALGAYNVGAAFIEAARYGRIEIVKYMLENCLADFRKDLKAIIKYPHTTRRVVYVSSFERTHYNNPINIALVTAAEYGHSDIVKLLIEYGANNYNGALYQAAAKGYVDIITDLINAGANDFNIALLKAAAGGHLDVAELMIKHGADNIEMAISRALEANNTDIVKLLMKSAGNNVICLDGVYNGSHCVMDLTQK